ncbi:hypothetical protein Tco_1109329 [Tanacetum coccineum]
MTVHTNLPKRILNAQTDVMKEENLKAENLGRLIKPIFETRSDGNQCFEGRIWLPLFGVLRDLIMLESYKSKYSIHSGSDKIFWKSLQEAMGTQLDMSIAYHLETNGQSERTIQIYHASIKAAPFKALYGRKCRSPICWSEVGDSQLTGLEMIRETTEKIVQIKDQLLTARSRQKSYADVRCKPIELDDKLHFIEEPVEIMDREVKQLKQSRIPIVKVRWNSRRGPEYTWEREDFFKRNYPHLFSSDKKTRLRNRAPGRRSLKEGRM